MRGLRPVDPRRAAGGDPRGAALHRRPASVRRRVLTRPVKVWERAAETPAGPARLETTPPLTGGALGGLLVVLGHGAGGNVDAPDLLAVTDRLARAGAAVVRVTQPYRVAGRRAPPPASRLDAAWLAVIGALRAEPPYAGARLVVGGRSSGARVAARTAAACGAVGIVALAFPLRPPRSTPDRSAELDAGVPVLVVQGERDSFGDAAAVRAATAGMPVDVVGVVGADHALRCRVRERPPADCLAEVADAVTGWLVRLGRGGLSTRR